MIVVSLLGHKQSTKIYHQLQFPWKKSGSLSAISIKSGQAATQSSTCSAVNASGTEREQTLLFFRFSVTGDNFAATVAKPFRCCHLFKNQRGSLS